MTARVESVAVFTGGSAGGSPVFAQAARDFGRQLALDGRRLVYGGGAIGLMGAVADAAIEAGGEVVGVMPTRLLDKEIGHKGLTELVVCDTMHERKAAMAARADAFVALPGGVGTLEEIFEAWTWQQIGYHAKPVAFFEVDGYWAPLLAALSSMSARGFMRGPYLDSLVVGTDAAHLLAELDDWTPPSSDFTLPG